MIKSRQQRLKCLLRGIWRRLMYMPTLNGCIRAVSIRLSWCFGDAVVADDV